MRFIEPETPGDFELIPSLAVMGAVPVRVKNGKYVPIRVDGKPLSVVELANGLMEKYDTIHYLDILSIRKGVMDWDLFRAVIDLGGNIWADMGVVYSEGIIDVIMAGAHQAVVTTKMIDSREEIVSSFELTENLILQIDFDRAVVSKDRKLREMGPGDLVKEMTSFGMTRFILDDIREDRGSADRGLIESVIENLPREDSVYVGVEEPEEIHQLVDDGMTGAIISCSRLLEGLE